MELGIDRVSETLTPLRRNSSSLNLARHGHRDHAPLTMPPESPGGTAERALLDTLESDGQGWWLCSLVKMHPAPNDTWVSDTCYVLHHLRSLQIVGEVIYDKRRWCRVSGAQEGNTRGV